jgi:hypothetical protein
MKKCAKCKKIKDLEGFKKDKARKDGRNSYCKWCHNELAKNSRRTIKGKAIKIFRQQRDRSKIKGYNPPTYTQDELVDYLMSNEDYLKLHEQWRKSGYKKLLSPSLDRLDNYRGYSFDNIRIVTWEENKIKGHSDVKNGLNNKQNKAVIKCDLNGVELESYHSMHHSARENELYYPNIWAACNGKIKSTGGFRWKYADHRLRTQKLN